jgi:hypothetical protein
MGRLSKIEMGSTYSSRFIVPFVCLITLVYSLVMRPTVGLFFFPRHARRLQWSTTCTNARDICTRSPLCMGRQSSGNSKNGSNDSSRKVKAVSKANLPSKICVVCGRPFTWRKKWERCWDEVTACSKRCNGERRSGNKLSMED